MLNNLDNGDRLTDWWPLSPLGYLFHATRSSSEDWGYLTDGDSDIFTLPTIRFLALLKNVSTVHQQPTIRHPNLIIFIGLTWTWSLSSLTESALSRLLYLGLCFSQQIIIHHQDNMILHCDAGWSFSLDSNPNIFPSQARASTTLAIWNWSDLEPLIIFIINSTCFE